jgi:hypothetical protein
MREVVITKAGALTIAKRWKDASKYQLRYRVDVICICGKKFTSEMYRLINGNTHSCGCYRKKVTTERNILRKLKST